MSRRRKTRTPVSNTKPPNDGTLLGHLSDADLMKEFARELARRRAGGGMVVLDEIESFTGEVQLTLGEETLAAVIAALPPEDDLPKPCPKCRQLVPVKAKNRLRHILTIAGELRLTRNYHHCGHCNHGFYPRDAELKLPEGGEVSDAMERRILDFGITTDGSMLLTREEGWKEAKVAVVARAEAFQSEKQRRRVDEARYVAVLGRPGGLQEVARRRARSRECGRGAPGCLAWRWCTGNLDGGL
ncbi:MAG: hypothetical protein ACYC8T_35940 [Myxococcaceae bacterium]